MAVQPALQKVFLLNQNYAHGQQVSRYFREAMAQQRPDVQVVGDELHPPFLGIDFTPFVQRIRDSGAQALVTGNWGADLRDMIQAMQRQGLTIPLYAYYPGLVGTPTALAESGVRLPVYQVAYNHSNQEGPIGELATAFRQRYGEDLTVYAAYDGIEMLAHAMAHVRSTEPARVAARLSGMIFRASAARCNCARTTTSCKKAFTSRAGRRWTRATRAAPRTPVTPLPRCNISKEPG